MNDLTKTFCHLIDTDKGYDNLALAEKCEQITDDFSVNFAEWFSDNCTEVMKEGKHIGKYYYLKELDFYTTTELLQIFKTEYYDR